MTWTAALFCLLGPAKVDVHEPGLPLSLLLPKLSAQFGRTLTVHPSLAREWILIDAEDVEPDDVLARIAEVTYADWQASGEGLRLERSEERERALAKAAQDSRREEIRAGLSKYTETAYDAAKVAHEVMRASQARERIRDSLQRPDQFFIGRIASAVPSEPWLSLPAGQEIVYSTSPNGTQRPFPPKARELLNRCLEANEAREAIFQNYEPEYRPEPKTRDALLKVRAFDFPRYLALDLSRVDVAGEYIGGSSMTIRSEPRPGNTFAKGISLPKDPVREEMGRILADKLKFGSASLATQAAVLHPERDGELVRIWGAAVRSFAGHQRAAVVANLTDANMSDFSDAQSESMDAGYWLSAMEGFAFHRSGPWLTVKIRYPGRAGENRGDYFLAARLLEKMRKGSPISIESGAEADLNLASLLRYAIRWGDRIDPRRGICKSGLISENEVGPRILGTLSEAQRRKVYAGRSIPFSEFPSALQKWLRNELVPSMYGSEDVFYEPDGRLRQARPPLTYALTSHDIVNSAVTAEVKTEIEFELADLVGKELVERERWGAETVASRLASTLQPLKSPPPGPGDDDFRFTHVRPVLRRKVILRLRLPNRCSFVAIHSDYQFPVPDRFVRPKDLSKPHRDLLLRLRREAEKEVTPDDGRTSP